MNVLDAVRQLDESEQLGAVVTIVGGPDVGAKAVIASGKGYVAGSLPDDVVDDVVADAEQLMDREQNRTLDYGDREIYIETVAPQPQLLMFGAGHIAQSLARMAPELGYRVIVADARKAWATAERFPTVDRLVVGWPDRVLEDIELDGRTYVVMLSHDARFEDPVFPAIRHAPIRYIGALGSRRTSRARAERLRGEGWSAEEIERIHAPIGIDIGAETPAEVAVSILAEMVRVRYGVGSGLSLRGVDGRIHAQRGAEDGTA